MSCEHGPGCHECDDDYYDYDLWDSNGDSGSSTVDDRDFIVRKQSLFDYEPEVIYACIEDMIRLNITRKVCRELYHYDFVCDSITEEVYSMYIKVRAYDNEFGSYKGKEGKSCVLIDYDSHRTFFQMIKRIRTTDISVMQYNNNQCNEIQKMVEDYINERAKTKHIEKEKTKEWKKCNRYDLRRREYLNRINGIEEEY